MKSLRPYKLLTFVLLALAINPLTVAAETQWGVHLASYRTRANALAGWHQILAGRHEFLSGLEHHLVPVSLPGKGEYLRLVAGPMQGREQALALADALQNRGDYAEAMPLDLGASPATSPPAARTPQSSTNTVHAPAPPVSPRLAEPSQPKAPVVAAPLAQAPLEKNKKNTSLERLGEALRKYVPAPQNNRGNAASSMPEALRLSEEEQLAREVLPSPPGGVSSGLSGKGHRVGFKNDSRNDEGVVLARPRNNEGRITALYGNMEEDFETPMKIAPLSPGETSSEFKPYLGFGLHF